MGLMDVHDRLLELYGPRGWWPLITRAGKDGRDSGGYFPGNRKTPDRSGAFEVSVGAVLTQNTTWLNAERALRNLAGTGILSPEGLFASKHGAIASIIRPSGYFNTKANTLLELSGYFLSRDLLNPDSEPPLREDLRALRGIGPETADSILLYAFGVESFVVDAYTRRILGRLGYASPGEPYDRLRVRIEREIPKTWIFYSELHALMVEHSKTACRKNPVCTQCGLGGNRYSTVCKYSQAICADTLSGAKTL